MRRCGPATRLVAAVLAAVALAGCALVDGMLETERALAAAGFADASVTLRSDHAGDVVAVTYRTGTTGEAFAEESARVAEVVWDTTPIALDAVAVHARGRDSGSGVHYPRDELLERFGPRAVRERPIGELLGGRRALYGGAAVASALLAVVVVTVVLVVRGGRRRRAALPYGDPSYGDPRYGDPRYGDPSSGDPWAAPPA